MPNLAKNVSLVFAAGCLGGLTNSLVVWFLGHIGITQALGVRISPVLSAAWLYPRIVWGGIWGLLFLIGIKRNRFSYAGLIYSLGPSMAQLFVIFPLKAGKGLLGLELGVLTPLFVVFYNVIWGATAELWLRWIRKR